MQNNHHTVNQLRYFRFSPIFKRVKCMYIAQTSDISCSNKPTRISSMRTRFCISDIQTQPPKNRGSNFIAKTLSLINHKILISISELNTQTDRNLRNNLFKTWWISLCYYFRFYMVETGRLCLYIFNLSNK